LNAGSSSFVESFNYHSQFWTVAVLHLVLSYK
jgi:hypothetical protein